MAQSQLDEVNLSTGLELQPTNYQQRRRILGRQILGRPSSSPSNRKHDCYHAPSSFSSSRLLIHIHPVRSSKASRSNPTLLATVDASELSELSVLDQAWKIRGNIVSKSQTRQNRLLSPRSHTRQKFHRRLDRTSTYDSNDPSRFANNQARVVTEKNDTRAAETGVNLERIIVKQKFQRKNSENSLSLTNSDPRILMSSDSADLPGPDSTSKSTSPAQHKPLVVGLRKPQSIDNMASSEAAAALNKEISENLKENTKSAAPAETASTTEAPKEQKKKEKAPKQPKAPKAAPAAAPTTPALIDLRVGHILRAIAHPNADSLYVSTIAMGDPEGTEHTSIDEATGKVVRTVCSGLKAYIPLEEMQDRKIIVVANLKPVNMRSIKSAAMVLAASPKQEEGADPHAADRVVELVIPPQGSEAGDKVYFEGWPYGDGRGPEKVLNPKKKQWEAIQPGFYTSDNLVVGFDASVCEEVSGIDKGDLVVEGKGKCTVKSLKGAVVR